MVGVEVVALRRLYDEIVGYPEERRVDSYLRPSDAVILSEAYPDLEPAIEHYLEDVRPGYVASLEDWYDEYTHRINNALSRRPSAGERLDEHGVWYKPEFGSIAEVWEKRGGEHMRFPEYVERYELEVLAVENPQELEAQIEGESRHWSANRGDDYPDWYEHVWNALQVGSPSGLERIQSHYPDEETQTVMGMLQAKAAGHLRNAVSEQGTGTRQLPQRGS